jgi:hypothetical protein
MPAATKITFTQRQALRRDDVATKDELTNGINVLIREGKRIGGRLTGDQWAAAGSEGGWSNRQILAHVAGVGAIVVPFVTSIANAAPGTDSSAGVDIDAMNAQIVGQRADKTVPQLVDELAANYGGVIEWLRTAPDELLERRASFAVYQDLTLSDLMMQVVVMHGIAHLYYAASGF